MAQNPAFGQKENTILKFIHIYLVFSVPAIAN